jgi:nucleotide-binding universal stress UspA family protein
MRFSRILIAVDFSEPSLAATRWIARHFGQDAEIVLAHVVDIPQPPSFLRGKLPPHDELVHTTSHGAEQRLAEVAASLGSHRVSAHVRVGRAAEQIHELAQEVDADLIAVGDHGRRRGIWAVLGTTAERLLESAKVPVLLAAHLPDGAPARVLAPVDASDLSRDVLVAAGEIARHFDAELIALHVFDPLVYGRVRLVAAPGGGSGGELRLSAEQWLEERIAELGLNGERTRACVALGVPGYEILSAANREAVELIVMGSRGGQPLSRVLLGSVARSVVRGAPCPIIVLRDA